MMDIRDLACFLIGIVFFLGGSPSIVRNASATSIHHKNNASAESTQDKSYTITEEESGNELNSVRNVLRVNEVPSMVAEIGPEGRDDGVSSGEEALGAIYTECLVQLSYACAQRKMLVYVSHLAARDNVSLVGDSLTLVRVGRGLGADLDDEMEARTQDMDVTALLDHSIEVFLRSHALRLRLPAWSTVGVATGKSRASGAAIDISFSDAVEEGRGKKKGGMKMAGMMMKMLMVGKGMMVPVMMGMTKFMAMKGFMMGMMSLMMSKMMILAKLKGGGGGGGGGGGWPMSGGGGWPMSGGGGGGWPMSGGGGGGGGGWPMMGGGGGGWSIGGGGGGGDWSGGGGGGGGGGD